MVTNVNEALQQGAAYARSQQPGSEVCNGPNRRQTQWRDKIAHKRRVDELIKRERNNEGERCVGTDACSRCTKQIKAYASSPRKRYYVSRWAEFADIET